MLQCNFCSATFQNLQRNSCFCLWQVAGGQGGGCGLAERGEFALSRQSAMREIHDLECPLLVTAALFGGGCATYDGLEL